jgi:two-component system nitrogen regulation response regulator GlnG
MDGTVLVADDDRTIRTVLTQALTRAGCKVHATSSLMTLMRWVDEGKGDLVISDVIMPDGNGLETLPQINDKRPGLPVIIISAQNTIMTAIQATEADAYDYLPKPFDLPDLMKRAARALDQKRRATPAPKPTAEQPMAAQQEDLPLVGRTPSMQALYRLVARVMNTDLPVLITGESGTGKSLIARAIHDFPTGARCPSWWRPPAIWRGWTAPRGDRAGQGRLDPVRRGGRSGRGGAGARSCACSTRWAMPRPRVMATSQKDLMERMEAGEFRQDLFYRLGGVTIAVPSLRERVDDIPLLANHFLGRAERDGAPRAASRADAMDLIRAYSWPGNVRQLENTIRRLTVTSPSEEITRPEVEMVLGNQPAIEPLIGGGDGRQAVGLGRQAPAPLLRSAWRGVAAAGPLRPDPAEVEMPLIEIALEATGGNQAKCADLLGINRNTLRKKITDLDIRVTRRRKLM